VPGRPCPGADATNGDAKTVSLNFRRGIGNAAPAVSPTGSVTTNGGGWILQAHVVKYGSGVAFFVALIVAIPLCFP
jgi:hypothetical protein